MLWRRGGCHSNLCSSHHRHCLKQSLYLTHLPWTLTGPSSKPPLAPCFLLHFIKLLVSHCISSNFLDLAFLKPSMTDPPKPTCFGPQALFPSWSPGAEEGLHHLKCPFFYTFRARDFTLQGKGRPFYFFSVHQRFSYTAVHKYLIIKCLYYAFFISFLFHILITHSFSKMAIDYKEASCTISITGFCQSCHYNNTDTPEQNRKDWVPRPAKAVAGIQWTI